MNSALSATIREHSSARAFAKSEMEKRVLSTAAGAAALEHNVKAAAGMQLSAAAHNSKLMENAAKALRTQVTEMNKAISDQQRSLEGLYSAVAETGSVAHWLHSSEATLSSVRGHFAAVEAALTAEG